ncbi:MAG: hypothetical protein ACRD3J_27210, partial [Thermoanaerobaculia bacterium]
MKIALAALCVIAAGACSPPSQGGTRAVVPVEDSSSTIGVPAGYGSLHQDDIAIRLEPEGMIVRAIPLNESIIRLLTPDSYRALRDLQESNRRQIEA